MIRPFFFIEDTKQERTAGLVLASATEVFIGVLDESGDDVVEEYVVEVGDSPGARFGLALITLGFFDALPVSVALDAIGKGRSREDVDGEKAREAFDVMIALANELATRRAEKRLPS